MTKNKNTRLAKIATWKACRRHQGAPLNKDVAHKLGLKMDHAAAELFTLYTGGDRRTVTTELEKLNLYLGKTRREVTTEDVRLLTPLSRAGVVFELGNAISSRQLARSIGKLGARSTRMGGAPPG